MTSYKVYRQHNCARRHESWSSAAKCIWAGSPSITGDGPFALLAKCDLGMARGLTWTVTLWPTALDAERAKEQIDEAGCAPGCYYDHELVQLDDAVVS